MSALKRRWKTPSRKEPGAWCIRYTLPDGTVKQESVGPYKHEAQQVLKDRLAEAAGGVGVE